MGGDRKSLLLESLIHGLWDWDWGSGLVAIGSETRALTGLPSDVSQPIRVEDWFGMIHPDDLDWFDACIIETADRKVFELDYRVRAANRLNWAWLHIRATVVRNAEGVAERVVGVHIDITARKNQEETLRLSEERYALSALASNDGLWDWDRIQHRIHYAERWNTMLGFPAEAGNGSPSHWLNRVHPEDLAILNARLEGAVGREGIVSVEYRLRDATENYRWMQCRAVVKRDLNGRIERIVGNQSDIHRRKMRDEQKLYDAVFDGLTGLPNRAAMRERLRGAMARRQVSADLGYAVVVFEIDRFKEINDLLGHHVGDAVLVEMGARLRPLQKIGALPARLGGQLGVALDPMNSETEVTSLVRRIEEIVAPPFMVEDRELFISLTMGIAIGTANYKDPEEPLRDANLALTRVKEKGGGQHEVFDAQRHVSISDRFRIESELRSALDHGGEFAVHFQPIIVLATGRLAGFEALMRWNNPTLGAVSPTQFIPIAEDTGLIVQLGLLALEQAIGRLVQWNKEFPSDQPLFMSVNVSGRQFAADGFIWLISDVLTDYGVNPELVKLEITESMLMDDPARTIASLQALKALRVKLAIDDFGTGYSSLSYLSRFPIDTLKIDQSFVGAMGAKREDEAIVRTVAALSHTLGLDVVAEGIEREEDRQTLVELGCEYGQGWLFGKALPADAARDLIARCAAQDFRLVDAVDLV